MELGALLKTSEGWWKTRSQLDKRWNMDGRSFAGTFTMPEGCRLALDAKKRELGSEPPIDLFWKFVKD